MTLTVNFINTERNEAIESFIDTLISKSFSSNYNITHIIVNLQTQSDQRVPWKSTIHIHGSKNITAESQAANYLTAFSQALTRAKRQWEKGGGIRA